MIGARSRNRRRDAARMRDIAEVFDAPEDQAFQGLLEAARLNSAWAWESIYESLAPRVLGWLRMESPDYAEDVLGDTFLCVVRDIHDFSGGERAFHAWVFRIARNRLLDAMRVKARRPQVVAADVPESCHDIAPDAAEQVMRRMERERIHALLRVLPEDQRTTVYMRCVLDASFAEVAAALMISVPAAKMLQQRAFRTLAARIPAVIAG